MGLSRCGSFCWAAVAGGEAVEALLAGLWRVEPQRTGHLRPSQPKTPRGEQQPSLQLIDLRPRRRQQLQRCNHRVAHLPVRIGSRAELRRTRPPQKELQEINRRRRHLPHLPRPPPKLISPGRQQHLPSRPLQLGLLLIATATRTHVALHPETVHHQQNVVNILLKSTTR